MFILIKMLCAIIFLYLTLILYPSTAAPTQVTSTNLFQVAKEGKLVIPKLANAFKLKHTFDAMDDYFNYHISDENLFKMINKQNYPSAHSDFHNYLNEQLVLIVEDVSKCKFKKSTDILNKFATLFKRLKDIRTEAKSKLAADHFRKAIKNRVGTFSETMQDVNNPFSSSFAEAEVVELVELIKDWKFTENHPLMQKSTPNTILELEALLKNELLNGKPCLSNLNTVEDVFIKFMMDFTLNHNEIMLKALDESRQGTLVAQYFFIEFLNKNKIALFEDVCECKLTPESEYFTVFNNYQFAHAAGLLQIDENNPKNKKFVREVKHIKIEKDKKFDKIRGMAFIKTRLGKLLRESVDAVSFMSRGVQVHYIRDELILMLMTRLEHQGYEVTTYNKLRHSNGKPILEAYADIAMDPEARALNLFF